MTTWRDIADQLTPAQIGNLEWLEGNPMGGLLTKPEQHLMLARGWAADNLEQSLHADIAPPADAVEVEPWRKSKTGERCRGYTSTVTGIAGLGITVEIRGVQYIDGRLECRIGLSGTGLADLDVTAARDVAAALLAAADQSQGK
ncbi:MAG: hypothetical protein ACR2JM_14635 [Mycobacterium sp.]